MRILFCGSGTFALPSLRAIHGSGHELALTVTPPPRRSGRGGRYTPTVVDRYAQAEGLQIFRCENINSPESVDHLREIGADVMVVAEFGQFIRAEARDTVHLDTFNLHGSILPRLRGAAPVNWAIIRGYPRTGLTTFSLVDAMDAGDVYLTEETSIGDRETAEDLRERLAAMGPDLVLRTLEAIGDGQAPAPQNDAAATYAPILKKSDGHLDFLTPAVDLARRIRGTWAWPGGRAIFHRPNGKTLMVTFANAVAESQPAERDPGVVQKDGAVATVEGRLIPLEVKPAGKRRMSWSDFLNGYQADRGGFFRSPENDS